MVMPNGTISAADADQRSAAALRLAAGCAGEKSPQPLRNCVALGADPELRSPSGSTALDYAKAACPGGGAAGTARPAGGAVTLSGDSRATKRGITRAHGVHD